MNCLGRRQFLQQVSIKNFPDDLVATFAKVFKAKVPTLYFFAMPARVSEAAARFADKKRSSHISGG
jgi:hypothetical protein